MTSLFSFPLNTKASLPYPLPMDGHALVMIDTEGYEKQVLEGTMNTMQRVSNWIVESHADERFVEPTPLRDIIVILDEYEFRFPGNIDQSLQSNGMDHASTRCSSRHELQVPEIAFPMHALCPCPA